jgi:4-amino-4-deoxy-L-arabinose transferase-like glycosyltransferase
VLLIALVFGAFALALLLTKRPWVDEAWFTGPALDLVTRGKFGTLLLDPAGSHLRLYKPDAFLRGIDQHTYWVMPLHPLQLAAWGKVFGFSVFSMRMPSLLWGGITLAGLGVIVRRLYGRRGAALMAAAVLAVDFGFVNGAADGRMDMTCAALGVAALAVYLSLREANFPGAVMAAHALAAGAVFTHPNGVFGSVGLLLTMLWLDRRRVRPLTVALIAVPYLVFGLLWADSGRYTACRLQGISRRSSRRIRRPARAMSRLPGETCGARSMGAFGIISGPRAAVWESSKS